MAILQTLDRGIKALFYIGSAQDGVSIADLAVELGVDRAIAYRIASTLEDNRLVTRSKDGRLYLGAGVLQLENHFVPQLRRRSSELLKKLAADACATAFLSIADGDDCVAIVVEEPEAALIRVGYRVGSRHPLDRGAAGIAILSLRAPTVEDLPEVVEARKDGFSVTRGALQKGAVGVAAPVRFVDPSRTIECCVGVVALADMDVDRAAKLAVASAQSLAG
ncbi:transcriptional regulator [Sulfitobacter sp. EhC04]|uniref:IclR family transcriptional regulator n=1 Tax=Sulfitobacter sp. EhC04 TaxID=1849168 RepID=UPI0007F4D852|nr:helix-turn-helix domain-containing protein [Sulfitobacter sp. EhC04]MAY86071.1 transcriptional regulator [Pseudooceanicola sp.]OAN80146.1 transcriptional regulator [Sulfitobacter sp. EhC04]|tara:strand:- start:1863 stop:2525 length:663 start_codon:yes stop_codon:yes gene_type:complete